MPLIFGFYLVFPLLYRSLTARRFLLLVVAVTAAIEFLYRAYALYFLDGVPVAFGNGFLPGLNFGFGQKVIPDDMPFQLWAPFGLFPSRIGEFAIRVAGGIIYAENSNRFERFLFKSRMAFLALTLWLGGNALLYAGLWGWIFADYFIAIGFTLVIIHLARSVLPRFQRVFKVISNLGRLSYYIFLTHLIFMFMLAFSYPYWGKAPLLALPLALLTVAGIAVTSFLLKRLDKWVSAEKRGFKNT